MKEELEFSENPDKAVFSFMTVADLHDANVDFIEYGVYEYEGGHVTPARMFCGGVCDCQPLLKTETGFRKDPGFESPIPIKRSDLGDLVGVLIP